MSSFISPLSSASRIRMTRPSSYVRTNIEGTANGAACRARRRRRTRRAHLDERGLRHGGARSDAARITRCSHSRPTPLPRRRRTCWRSRTIVPSASMSRPCGRSTPTGRGNPRAPSSRPSSRKRCRDRRSSSVISRRRATSRYVLDTVDGFIRVGECRRRGRRDLQPRLGPRDLRRRPREQDPEHCSVRRDRSSLSPSRQRPATSEVERLCADASRIQRLGWAPRVTLG